MQQYPRAYVLSSLAVVLNVTAPAFDIRGGGTPDHVPTLTVSYHDAA
jgi:hypothetical protein